MPQHVIIGGELEPRGMSGIALDAKYIIDSSNGGVRQSDINHTVGTLSGTSNFVTIPAVSTDTSIGAVFNRVSITAPATDTLYRIGNWKHNGSPQYNENYYSVYGATNATIAGLVPIALSENGIDDKPTPGSTNLVASGGVAGSIVYDISEAHNGAVYEDLATALGTNGVNVPEPIRKGGMSVKFIQGTAQSNDNKYVQYRCKTQSFSSNPKDWEFCNDIVITKNPEFVETKTDIEEKLIEAIKKDGTKVFGADIEIKGRILNEEFERQKETLSYFEPIDNPEWVQVTTDKDKKVVSGRDKKGRLKECVGIDAEEINAKNAILNNVTFQGGIPQQIQDYVDEVFSVPNVDEINHVNSLGTPITLMDYNYVYPNGDIEAKYNYTSVLRKTPSMIYLYYGVTDRNRDIAHDNFLKIAYCDLSAGEITNPNNWHRIIPNDVAKTPSQKWQEWYEQQTIIPVTFDTDALTTRLSIPEEQRYAGMIISYNNGSEDVVERYGYLSPPAGKTWDDAITATDSRTYNDIYKDNDYWIRIENIYNNSNYPYFEDLYGDPILHCYGGGTIQVPDTEYPFRSFQLAKMPLWKGSASARFNIYMWKSKDGIIFEKCKFIDLYKKNTGSQDEQFEKDGTIEPIIRGNIIKLYTRWRPYPFTKRQIGEEDVDIEGNLICVGHHLFGENSLYIPAASTLDYRRDILFPTYIPSGTASESIKCFIRDNNRIVEVNLPDDFSENGTIKQQYVGNNVLISIQKNDSEVKQYIIYDAATWVHDSGPNNPNFNYLSNCAYIKIREIKFGL